MMICIAEVALSCIARKIMLVVCLFCAFR